MKRLPAILDGLAAVGIFATSMVLVWTLWHRPAPAAERGRGPARPPDLSRLVEDVRPRQLTMSSNDVPRLNPTQPGSIVIEFSDFQCPFCGRYARETYGQVQREFVESGKVSYVFMNFPLETIHPLAFRAAVGAECARQQGRFWEMHDALFQHQDAIDEPGLVAAARTIHLDDAAFMACLAGAAKDKITHDITEGKRLSIVGTPTLGLGTVDQDGTIHVNTLIRGAIPYETLKPLIQAQFETRLSAQK